MDKRKEKRLNAKLHVKLNSGGVNSWGLLDDISENGLFIKSIRDIALDTVINIEIIMQDNSISLLKGIVKRRIELPDEHRKYGIGIELTKKDVRFINLVVSFLDYSDMKTVNMMG